SSLSPSSSSSSYASRPPDALHSFPTRRSSDLIPTGGEELDDGARLREFVVEGVGLEHLTQRPRRLPADLDPDARSLSLGSFTQRSEEHTSELQSLRHLVCRLLLEKKKKKQDNQ